MFTTPLSLDKTALGLPVVFFSYMTRLQIVSDYFSGPSTALDLVCVCVCMRTVTFQQKYDL